MDLNYYGLGVEFAPSGTLHFQVYPTKQSKLCLLYLLLSKPIDWTRYVPYSLPYKFIHFYSTSAGTFTTLTPYHYVVTSLYIPQNWTAQVLQTKIEFYTHKEICPIFVKKKKSWINFSCKAGNFRLLDNSFSLRLFTCFELGTCKLMFTAWNPVYYCQEKSLLLACSSCNCLRKFNILKTAHRNKMPLLIFTRINANTKLYEC